jgi:hypothetical protein
LTNTKCRITKGRLTAGFVVLVVAALGVLPLLVFKGPYGEVPTPGSATVHLPAGEVDVTLRTAGPAGDVPVPPLSIHVFGPDGITQPEVIESPRRKYADSQGNMLVRVWVVRIAQEADYHIAVEGEVYRPYQPPLTFGRPMWNEALETLVILGGMLWFLPILTALIVFVVMGPLLLILKVRELCAKHQPRASGRA